MSIGNVAFPRDFRFSGFLEHTLLSTSAYHQWAPALSVLLKSLGFTSFPCTTFTSRRSSSPSHFLFLRGSGAMKKQFFVHQCNFLLLPFLLFFFSLIADRSSFLLLLGLGLFLLLCTFGCFLSGPFLFKFSAFFPLFLIVVTLARFRGCDLMYPAAHFFISSRELTVFSLVR